MRELLLAGVATLIAGAAWTNPVAAAPVQGAAIAEAASAVHDAQSVHWRWHYLRPGVRRGRCLNSPARC
jgi:hypothetical protein